MRVLVTGGTSLIGVGVARRLAERGDSIVSLQRSRSDALAETDGNRAEAARRLGISRSTLYEKLKKWRDEVDAIYFALRPLPLVRRKEFLRRAIQVKNIWTPFGE